MQIILKSLDGASVRLSVFYAHSSLTRLVMVMSVRTGFNLFIYHDFTSLTLVKLLNFTCDNLWFNVLFTFL